MRMIIRLRNDENHNYIPKWDEWESQYTSQASQSAPSNHPSLVNLMVSLRVESRVAGNEEVGLKKIPNVIGWNIFC